MSKGSWTHTICGECWIRHATGDERLAIMAKGEVVAVVLPVRVIVPGEPEQCCFCVNKTTLGAYIRTSPISADLKCKDATGDLTP